MNKNPYNLYETLTERVADIIGHTAGALKHQSQRVD